MLLHTFPANLTKAVAGAGCEVNIMAATMHMKVNRSMAIPIHNFVRRFISIPHRIGPHLALSIFSPVDYNSGVR
jgi:hypothetical protein